jgi:TPR repeat protein
VNVAQIAARIFKDSTDPVSSSAKPAVPVGRMSLGTLPLPPALPAISDLSALSATKNSLPHAAVSREFAQPPDNSPAKESAVRSAEAEHAANAAGEGPAAVIMARELLRKDGTLEQRDEALRLLWQAVAKGNVAAELELAEVYLAGQGADKSCSQARVLLNAAVSRKSPLAKQKLADLAAYGCE